MIIFSPTPTVPNVTCPRPVSSNGNVIASWTYVHTGGLPLTYLSVMYSYEEGALTVSRSVGVNLNDLSVTVSRTGLVRHMQAPQYIRRFLE